MKHFLLVAFAFLQCLEILPARDIAGLISTAETAYSTQDSEMLMSLYESITPEQFHNPKLALDFSDYDRSLLKSGWSFQKAYYNSLDEFTKRDPKTAKDILDSYKEPLKIEGVDYVINLPIVGVLFIPKTSKDGKMSTTSVLPVARSKAGSYSLAYPVPKKAQQDAAANP